MDLIYIKETIWDNWTSGGIMMVFLFSLAMFIFVIAFEMILYLKNKKISAANEDKWIEWARNPNEAQGTEGVILRYTRPFQGSPDVVRRRFMELREMLLGNIERKSNFLKSLVAVAPLMGLLGTVMGMLTTFQGIATSGGNQTVDMVAKGISTALITTQTGLMIALPGLFLTLIIRRRMRNIGDAINRMEGMVLGQRKE
jgi:biopolymer transport protein ExbB